jgi:hypothetical protein
MSDIKVARTMQITAHSGGSNCTGIGFQGVVGGIPTSKRVERDMLPPRGRESGFISLLCVLLVLLALTGASIVEASPAQITGDWMYEIRARDTSTIPDTDFLFSNAGPIRGIGDIGGGVDPILGPSISFDITANGVRVSGRFNGCELGIPCSLFTTSFSIDDGTVAISGSGNGGAAVGGGFASVSDLGRNLPEISIPSLSDTAVIFEARAVIQGSASPLVSEPTDSAFLVLFVGLVAALFRSGKWRPAEFPFRPRRTSTPS